MIALLASLALAGPSDPQAFTESLHTAVTSNDESFLKAFFYQDLQDATDEQAAKYIEGSTRGMKRWLEDDPHLECRASMCLLQAGEPRRPKMYLRTAPEGHAIPYVSHSSKRQMQTFSERLTLSLKAEGQVRVTINGARPFMIDTVQDDNVETSYLNDWLVIGDNTITVQPVDGAATIDLRVGGHAVFSPSPDKARHNRAHFEGTLTEARSWTVSTKAAEPNDDTPWPTDAAAHLETGLANWLAGGEEYSFAPWPAWVKEDVRQQLIAAKVQRLEVLIMEIDITVGEQWHLRGWFVPHATKPVWAFAELTEKAGRGEYAVADGPRKVWSDQASMLVESLRSDGCPAIKNQAPTTSIVDRMARPSIQAESLKRGKDTTDHLRKACDVLSALPSDASITYSTDDVLIVGLGAKGSTAMLVDGEVGFRSAWPFLVSVLKPARVPR